MSEILGTGNLVRAASRSGTYPIRFGKVTVPSFGRLTPARFAGALISQSRFCQRSPSLTQAGVPDRCH